MKTNAYRQAWIRLLETAEQFSINEFRSWMGAGVQHNGAVLIKYCVQYGQLALGYRCIMKWWRGNALSRGDSSFLATISDYWKQQNIVRQTEELFAMVIAALNDTVRERWRGDDKVG